MTVKGLAHSRFWTVTAIWIVALLLFSVRGSAQQPQPKPHKHVPDAVSNGQAPYVRPMGATQVLKMAIMLPVRNQAALTSLLSELYNPASPRYRQFLSVEEFTDQFSPTQQDYDAVTRWAGDQGFTIVSTSPNRLVLDVSGTIGQVNTALNVSINEYRRLNENRTFFSPDREPTLDPTLPISHIEGLNNFSIPRPMLELSNTSGPTSNIVGSGPGGSYLPSDIRSAYYGGSLTGAGQCIGLFEFGGYRISDVNLTFANAGQSYSVPINNVLVDGATAAAGKDDTEQVLDIVQAIGMAPGLNQVRVYIGPSGQDADILNSMATENACKALSVSWSWVPDDSSTNDTIFQEFAAQGQSVFVASGDNGAYDMTISPYFYPAEDAYVTAVGGTHLFTNYGGGPWVAEAAWNNSPYGSGGGVSPDQTPIPSWQQGVATYSNGGSNSFRSVPDVAMEADQDNYYCALGVCGSGAGGTSFAAPRWAGLMALINQQASEAGKAPAGGLGFINPTLYSTAEGTNYSTDFHDITSGDNDSDNQPTWYSALSGYDLVTGWGSPNGQSLLATLGGSPVSGFWLSGAPATHSIARSSSGTATLSVIDAGGFTGSVSLKATGLPSGVTASFSPSSTTGNSVLTLTASSTATLGTATVTVTGTSGSLSAKTSLFLTISAVAVAPPPVSGLGSVNLGASSSATTETLTFVTAGTLSSISVLTQGIANLDFTNSGGGTCTLNKAYKAGATCTVIVKFAPTFAGTRYGAVVLADVNGNTLGQLFLEGTSVGPQVTFAPGAATQVVGGLTDPVGTAILGDHSLYVTDYGASGSSGALYFENFSSGTYTQSNTNCALKTPAGVAVDGGGTVYITDSGKPAAYKLTLKNGACTETAIGTGFGTPWGIAVDGNGDVYITDVGTSTIASAVWKETLQTNGTYVQSQIGSGWVTPVGIAIDASGRIDIADAGIPGVYMETPAGSGYSQSAIGGGWTTPTGIAVDGAGNVYVSEAGNRIVYGGSVPAVVYRETPLSGSYRQTAVGSGWVAPYGLAVDGNGNVYVTDQTRGVFKSDLADPFPLAFANTLSGVPSSDSPRTVTVANQGTATLQFSSVSYPADFPENSGVSSDCTSTTSLAPGLTCTLSINFLPTAALGGNSSLPLIESIGIKTNTLGIAGTPQQFSVTGTEVLATGSVGLSVSSDPAAVGTPITFTATVAGSAGGPTPTGTVTIYSGSTALTGPLSLSAGVATYSTSSLSVGTYAILALYSGDANYQAANSSTVTESIVGAPGTSGLGTANFGNQNIGSATNTNSIAVTFSTAETLGSVSVLTGGVPNLDFANAGGGTCSIGTAYAANTSCTVNVTFTPAYAGTRYGAIVLTDNNGNLIGTGSIEGTGVGPQSGFLPGALSSLATGLGYPQGVAVDGGGNLYVADTANGAVYKETLSNGTYSQSTVVSGFSQPYGITLDGAGDIYVTDIGNHAVYKETPSSSGYIQTVIGYGFVWPSGVAVDTLGNVYITDFGNGVTPGTVYLETLINGSYTQSAIGRGFTSPESVAVDGSGNIYVADSANGNGTAAVYKLTPTNGSYNQVTIGSGWVTPTGVALDGIGNVYIADDAYDLGSGLIVKETLQSDGTYVQSTALASATTLYPGGVAVDGRGNLYVSDNLKGIIYRDDFADPPALTFANGMYGTTSSDSPKSVTVQNVGNANLAFSALSYPADFPEQAGIPTDCTSSTSLGSRAVCTLSIDFTPSSLSGTNQPTLLTENVAITTNTLNAGTSDQTVAVSGSEIPPVATIAVTVPANVATVGSLITFTATVAGQSGVIPTGSVTFYANGAVLSTSPLTNGAATYSTSSLGVGAYSVTATYSGDQVYPGSTSAATTEQVIPASTFGTQNVGSTGSTTVTVTFASSATLGSIAVVTQGVENLDYTNAGGGTCTVGTAYAAQATCTVKVAFTPRFSGARYGAVVLGTSSGTLIQAVYLQGWGVGPQLSFPLGTQAAIGSTAPNEHSLAVDGSGNVYELADNTSGTPVITKWTLSGTAYTSSTIATSVTLNSTDVIAVDGSGAVYISDTYKSGRTTTAGRIVKEMPVAGAYKESIIETNSCPFGLPIAVDALGSVYIANACTSQILKDAYANGAYTESTLSAGTLNQFSSPSTQLAIDGSGNIYVEDYLTPLPYLARVLKLSPTGGQTYAQTIIASSSNNHNSYIGLAVDGNASAYFFNIVYPASGPATSTLVKATPSASGYTQATLLPSQNLQVPNACANPEQISIDGNQNAYVTCDNKLVKFDLADPSKISYSATNVGSANPQTFTVSNIGNAPLTLSVPTQGTNPSVSANFALGSASTCPQVAMSGAQASLSAGNSCVYSVNFSPTTTGTISGSLTITDNAASTTQTIPLIGTGTSGSGGMAVLRIGPGGVPEGVLVRGQSSSGSANYYGVWADTTDRTLVSGYLFFQQDQNGNIICNEYSTPSVSAGPNALFGTLYYSTEQYKLAGGQCPGMLFPFRVARYTWGVNQASNQAVEQDPFVLQAISGIYDNAYGFKAELAHISIVPSNPTSCSGQAQASGTAVLVNPPPGATSYMWQITGGAQVHFLNGQQTISSTNSSVPIDFPANAQFSVKVSTQSPAVLSYGPTPYAPAPPPTLSITKLQYTNSLNAWLDSPSNPMPTPMTKTVWETAGGSPAVVGSYDSVFVSSNTIQAAAAFNVSQPPVSALPGTRIYGTLSNNLGTFVACVDIPAGATSLPLPAPSGATQPLISFTGANPFPASTTQNFNPLQVTWKFSPTGQDCSANGVQCSAAGSTSSQVYVTLAQPAGFTEQVMPMTAVKLGIGSGGATTQAAALSNTWAQFAGPANVTAWDNSRKLYYYKPGIIANSCATSSVQLLSSATGSGQCGSFANLLMDALAVNGITSSFTQIQPTDHSWMLVRDWSFTTPSNLYPPPYNWNLVLPLEGNTGIPGMVETPQGTVFGGLTSLPTIPGQNTTPPAEKAFTSHFIIQAPASLGGGYYDPSYGVTYTGNCDFETKAIVAYVVPQSQTSSTVSFAVRQASGCNITFSTLFTN